VTAGRSGNDSSPHGDSPHGDSPRRDRPTGDRPTGDSTDDRTARPRRRPSRRAALLGGLGIVVAGGVGAGYELVQDGTLPGKYTLARLTGACGSPPARPGGTPPVRSVLSFYSAFRHRQVTMVTLTPPRMPSPPGYGVVVALHGAGSDAQSMADQVSPAMTAARISSFATVTVDGGDTYWHDRADGDDPIGMVVREVLPRLAAQGMHTSQIGLTGESMGGYGALLLAEQLSRPALLPRSVTAAAGRPAALPRPVAVAALSPAIFASYADARAANRAAFDDQADFDRNDIFASLTALRTVPTLVSCGADDPFEPEAALLRARLASLTGREPQGGILSGCHDDTFWERNLPASLRFIGEHLPG
jgi:acetyl esterase/lipase